MKIVVPHTRARLRDETVEALRAHMRDSDTVEFVDVSGHDLQLWETWQWAWQAREDVIWVEHDIVIGPDTIPGFEACQDEWCAHGYEYAHFGVYAGTGCVRFRASLMRAFPDLWDQVGRCAGRKHPPKHWCSLDAFSKVILSQQGYRQHLHEPAVAHLGVGVSHGCLTA